MAMLQTVFAFVVTLGILVSVHEFGHFWVARKMGVKVLRFCVGFGKPLWFRTGKDGTEYAVAAIPLGGYVKMLDEREGDVPEDERHLSFNSKPVLARMAIVAAGPIANFVLAIVALWLMYLLGITTLAPVVGEVTEGSPAYVAGVQPGDEVVAVDGASVDGWQAVNLQLVNRIGESGSLVLTILPEGSSAERERTLTISQWLVNDEAPQTLKALGITPFTPNLPPVLAQVSEGGTAQQAGLQTGDRIVAVDGMAVAQWPQFVEIVRGAANRELAVVVERDGLNIPFSIIPKGRDEGGQTIGFIGAGVQPYQWPQGMIREVRLGPLDALIKGVESTWSLTTMTFSSIAKMISGLLSVKNLSGPITIAKVAGASIESGLESFLYFLAMLSVSLGVLNLLPIPVLDGGHLLFYAVELMFGKALPERVQQFGFKVGVAFIMFVMVVAMYNDVLRLLS